MEIEESVRQIRQAVDAFPGLLLGLKRQTGKTTAVLEMIHDKHDGAAFYFGPTEQALGVALARYGQMYPGAMLPKTAQFCDQVLGSILPVYVDEWWLLRESAQRRLMEMGQVVCRIGTDR
jgi:hypothetical protein